MQVTELHDHAALALIAAHYAAQWGEHAAIRYAVKRGCPMRLVKIALYLERDVHHELY